MIFKHTHVAIDSAIKLNELCLLDLNILLLVYYQCVDKNKQLTTSLEMLLVFVYTLVVSAVTCQYLPEEASQVQVLYHSLVIQLHVHTTAYLYHEILSEVGKLLLGIKWYISHINDYECNLCK